METLTKTLETIAYGWAILVMISIIVIDGYLLFRHGIEYMLNVFGPFGILFWVGTLVALSPTFILIFVVDRLRKSQDG